MTSFTISDSDLDHIKDQVVIITGNHQNTCVSSSTDYMEALPLVLVLRHFAGSSNTAARSSPAI